jgi:ribosome maturation factor RimP
MAELELEKIGRAVERVVAGEGLELVGWALRGQGPKSLLRVTIDRADGITHDDCVAVNNQLGTILDVEDLIPFGYTLEVTSPGLGKALSGRAGFDRHRGEVARVRAASEIDGRVSFKGQIARVTPDSVTLAEAGGREVTIPFSNIVAANLVQVPQKARTGGSVVEGNQ